MQISECLNEGLKRSWKVAFSEAVVAQTWQDKYLEVGKKARLPGFRPGKVPLSLLKQRYQNQVRGEVLEALCRQGARAVTMQAGGQPAETPRVEIEREEEGKALDLVVHLELLPAITLKPFDGFHLERLVCEVDPAAVEKELVSLGEAAQEWQKAGSGHAVAKGDRVTVRFRGAIDGKDMGFQDRPCGIVAGSQTGWGESLPGVGKALEGRKEGDVWDMPVVFPKNHGAKEWAGKTASLNIRIENVETAVPVKVDDAFAQRMKHNSLVELRETLRHHLQSRTDERTFTLVKRALLDSLAEQYRDVLVPQGLVEKELASIWKEFEDFLKARGEPVPDDDATRKEYRAIAERRVRLGLVLAEIGQKEKVVVDKEELTRAVVAVAQRYPGKENEVFRFYRDHPEELKTVQAPLFERKVVQLVLSRNTLKTRTVTLDELDRAEEQEDEQEAGKAGGAPEKKSVTRKKKESAA